LTGVGQVKSRENGGRKAWELESRELVTDPPAHVPASITPDGPVRGDLRARRDEVRAKLGTIRPDPRRGSAAL
jgi:hypothetical protein